MCSGGTDADGAILTIADPAVGNPRRDEIDKLCATVFKVHDHKTLHHSALDDRQRQIQRF